MENARSRARMEERQPACWAGGGVLERRPESCVGNLKRRDRRRTEEPASGAANRISRVRQRRPRGPASGAAANPATCYWSMQGLCHTRNDATGRQMVDSLKLDGLRLKRRLLEGMCRIGFSWRMTAMPFARC